MHLDTSFVRSKFSRRIFLLFFLSAVLPITVAAVVSYSYVSAQLRAQSYEQSRQSSKAVGMELFERLSLANAELRSIATAFSSQADGASGDNRQIPGRYSPRFTEIAVIPSTNEVIGAAAKSGPLPTLEKKQEQHLAEGGSVIFTRNTQDESADIEIVTLLDHEDPGKGKLIGKINPEYLWKVKDNLSTTTGLAILDSSNMLLFRTESFQSSTLQSLNLLLSTSSTGHYESTTGKITHLVAYWSLFTEARFSMPGWTIVVSRSEQEALAPIISFRSIYIPMLALVILAVSFISATQIRRRLAPLATLKEATRRIAGGDFTGQVNITGSDEFAQLGSAFNSMAGRLERQFKSLRTLAEIDRLILSSFDARYITATVLGRACDLTPCSVVAMIEFDEDHACVGQVSARFARPDAEVIEERIQLSKDDIHRLTRNPHSLLLDCAEEYPAYLNALVANPPHNILLLPMFIKQHLAAVIVFGYTNEYKASEEELGLLRKFADHVAVALSNASWEERLYHQAHYDALTNLPNRALLTDRLEQAIARAQRNDSYVGVIFLDLDRFKVVNDSLGHSIGDLLLKEVASLLTKTVREVDTIVRFGGDEFVAIIPDINRKVDVVFELGAIAEKILYVTQHEIFIDSHKVRTGMSIGIAVYPRDGNKLDELIKNADIAMYHAKEQGRGQYSFYSPELNAETLRRLTLEHELRKALDNDEFELFYQAKVNASGSAILGAEALIRWLHPERGLVAPIEFIGIAEETGLIHAIGEWVIKTACSQMKIWHSMGLSAIRTAVNVSSHQFNEGDFAAQVSHILKATGLNPELLELEVTESVVMMDTDKSIETLKRLNAMGIRIAVDDFGTGYSSLSYLRRLPIHTLKIDRSFITDMMGSSDAQSIVSATILLAHQLGLDVVAEGVETSDQQALLIDWGCDELQGYLFSKPLPVGEFEKLLRQHQGNLSSSGPPADGFTSASSG